jgi:alkylation response protein AidB-like acyl-CoA dehydrogenase
VAALPGSERGTLERFRAALDQARELMRRAERAARRRAWREAVQQLKASEAEIDRANYELIREMRAAGLSWPAIGGELGQRNWTAVYQRFQRLERRFGHGRPDSNEPPTTPSRDG